MDRVEHEHVRTAGIADVDTVGCRIHRNESARTKTRYARDGKTVDDRNGAVERVRDVEVPGRLVEGDAVAAGARADGDRRHRRRHRRVDVVDLDQVGTEHRDEEPTSGRVDSHAIRLLLRRQHRLPVIGLARLIERPRLEVEAVGVDIKQPMRRLVDRHT